MSFGNPPWTDEEDDILRARWKENVSAKAIAFELGRTVGSVRRRRINIDLPLRRFLRKRFPGKQRDAVITVALDDDVHDWLSRRSFQKGMTMAVYVRMLIDRDRGR